MHFGCHLKFFIIIDVLLLLSITNPSFSDDTNTSIAIDCGATSQGKDGDGRNWDVDTKYLSSQGNSQTIKASFQDPSLPSEIPYMTARVSNSDMSYKFPINSTSRYFLRLHFYPTSYSSFNISNSYFSVIAADFTLLNNFSAAVTAEALTQAYIIKEYSLAPLDRVDSLVLVFKPSNKHAGSFAFINGIELVPTPNLLDSANLLGFSDQSLDGKTATTETIARLNVGGNYIPPTNDSGLLRTWYDDTPYILGAAAGVTSSDNNTKGVHYKDMPKYIAPIDVYNTWRSMGPDPNITLNYNLTWSFSVDPTFTYIIRLHFCEHIYTKVNQRLFNIFIYNQTATPSGADVIAWTGSKDVPIYKDYAVSVQDGKGQQELLVALHPRDGVDKPEFYDAILNGLEMFKVSDGNKNLAGPNPSPSEALVKADKEKRENFTKDKPNINVIGAASGVAAAFGLATVLAVVLYKKKSKMPRSKSGTSSWLPIYGNSHTSGMKSTIGGSSVASAQLSTEATANCRHFTLAEIRKATKHFDESHVIGVGGFGKVYKGVIDGSFKVAIKKSNPSSEQGVHEFVTEIEMLSKLRHKHLVSLIGYCEEDGEMALVYDFMAHGTLREHLYKGNKINLTWKQRLEMLIGAAKGLHYLHTGAKYTIIHRDVKTTNILLDENWVAKISDFGLSKTGPETNQNHASTVVKGSFGYLDPEYFRRQQLTEKSDVYSFGVVLFEILCARPALNPSLPKEQVSLADWARSSVKKGNIDEIIDPHIKGTIKPECLKKFVETAFKCLSDHGVDRPSMSDLLWNLEFSLQLQESGDASKATSNNGRNNQNDNINMHLNTLNLEEDDQFSATTSSSNEQNSSTAIFSQIVHQTGR
ncbi:receptor-like protein kinase ANXUR1 [Chenopodium quinoa]|uniref:non-specific serine/threonine protein kinase n=1 Tax=Chenopodium quinoa TaxID=63459 RepID=A0A803N3L3_CHEQI|nr:receptor-like protein kinase ANXUR1 [Chenopodium quinoa]